MVDFVKIAIALILIYLAFVIFSRVTRFLLKLAIVAIIIFIIAFGFIDMSSILGIFSGSEEDGGFVQVNETLINETNSSISDDKNNSLGQGT